MWRDNKDTASCWIQWLLRQSLEASSSRHLPSVLLISGALLNRVTGTRSESRSLSLRIFALCVLAADLLGTDGPCFCPACFSFHPFVGELLLSKRNALFFFSLSEALSLLPCGSCHSQVRTCCSCRTYWLTADRGEKPQVLVSEVNGLGVGMSSLCIEM